MLKTKIVVIVIFLLLCVSVYFYYSFNTSFTLSSEAKKYYQKGEYNEAYALAKKAYEENSYNRMAFTYVVHSKEAIKWQKYIKQTKKYLKYINEISLQDELLPSDKNRIKMICEISIANYKKLNKNTMLIDKLLKDEAIKLHEQIVEISKKL